MSKKKNTILSIDWDVFFEGSESLRNPCDACSWLGELCSGGARATTSAVRPTVGSLGVGGYKVTPENWLRRGDELPPWFSSITPNVKSCPITVAECHGDIRELVTPGCTIVNLDAHDDFNLDCPLNELEYDTLNCGNWGFWVHMCKSGDCAWVMRPEEEDEVSYLGNTKGTVKWKKAKYEKVFICTSRPWTPAWFDRRFYPFLHAVSDCTNTSPRFIGPSAKSMRRRYTKEIKK